MNNVNLFLGLLQITLLDLALCADNIGLIALATKNLSRKSAKLASLLGIAGAIFLRIYFAACISIFFKMKWLPIKLVGGIVLIKVTWDLIKPQVPQEKTSVKESEKFWDAVLTVLIADITMSIDNVLAIAAASNGNIMLITFGILLNIPIIFFGSQFVLNLMKKSAIIIYIGASVLSFTSSRMILEDYWFRKLININHSLTYIISLISAILVFVYGIYRVNKNKNKLSNNKMFRAS